MGITRKKRIKIFAGTFSANTSPDISFRTVTTPLRRASGRRPVYLQKRQAENDKNRMLSHCHENAGKRPQSLLPMSMLWIYERRTWTRIWTAGRRGTGLFTRRRDRGFPKPYWEYEPCARLPHVRLELSRDSETAFKSGKHGVRILRENAREVFRHIRIDCLFHTSLKAVAFHKAAAFSHVPRSIAFPKV